LKGGIVMALVGAIHFYAASHIPFQWHLALAQTAAVMVGVSLPFLKTASTKIVIDAERITWQQGFLYRRVSSLALSRIHSVTSVQPRWQRLFGTGSVILMTSDDAHPVRRLPGIKDADQLCLKLAEAMRLQRLASPAQPLLDEAAG
jgi:membrane protein YdbS with pleckstrin-like domain